MAAHCRCNATPATTNKSAVSLFIAVACGRVGGVLAGPNAQLLPVPCYASSYQATERDDHNAVMVLVFSGRGRSGDLVANSSWQAGTIPPRVFDLFHFADLLRNRSASMVSASGVSIFCDD